MPSEEQWQEVTEWIRWGMVDAGADSGGQQKMVHAARQNNEAWMGEFKEGFEEVYSGEPIRRAIFHACCSENQGRVYGIGRRFVPNLIEARHDSISKELAIAGMEQSEIDRLLAKVKVNRKANPVQWKCKRWQIQCDPGPPVKYGYHVLCTVTYDDGSTDETDEEYC